MIISTSDEPLKCTPFYKTCINLYYRREKSQINDHKRKEPEKAAVTAEVNAKRHASVLIPISNFKTKLFVYFGLNFHKDQSEIGLDAFTSNFDGSLRVKNGVQIVFEVFANHKWQRTLLMISHAKYHIADKNCRRKKQFSSYFCSIQINNHIFTFYAFSFLRAFQ